MWLALRRRQLGGLKFRRQYGVGRYVLDFYCPAASLGVELDGSVHDDPIQEEYDAARTRFLAEAGVRVIRFANEAVRDDLEGVCEAILRAATEPRGSSDPTP